jgi:RNA polymerase sigma-70 factor (ECF subfamily)
MPHNNADNEYDLLVRLNAGDLEAFDELYWKYQNAVYQNAFKLTRDGFIAEDIVQEVFIKLWEKRKSIDVNRKVGGWLFVASYNRSISSLKKKIREFSFLKEIQSSDISAETLAEEELQLKSLEEAIARLSPQKRRVFLFCKINGMTYEEAAKSLNISKHTVKEYLSSAIVDIKNTLNNLLPPDLPLQAMFIFGFLDVLKKC